MCVKQRREGRGGRGLRRAPSRTAGGGWGGRSGRWAAAPERHHRVGMAGIQLTIGANARPNDKTCCLPSKEAQRHQDHNQAHNHICTLVRSAGASPPPWSHSLSRELLPTRTTTPPPEIKYTPNPNKAPWPRCGVKISTPKYCTVFPFREERQQGKKKREKSRPKWAQLHLGVAGLIN